VPSPGLPRELVLYSARHDFGSLALAKTGNLKAVMNAMGHGDVRSAMVYQHPEGEIIRVKRTAHFAAHRARRQPGKCLNLTWIGPQTAFRGR
jgi:site-specific recombinase XerC